MPSQFVSIGPLTLNLYTTLITLAVLVPSAWACLQTRDWHVVVVASVVALFALTFGRAGYIALHWEYFRERTDELFSLAGLSEHGAIWGGTMALLLSQRAVRLTLPPSVQRWWLPLAFLLAGIAASIGCIPNGCAYGQEVFWQTDGEHSLAWLLHADWPDAYSINNPRWPTQAFMAFWLITMGISWAVWVRRQANSESYRPALPAIGFVIPCFATGDFLIQFLRGDPAPAFAGLRIYQWLDMTLLASVAAILILGTRRAR